jgi:hypothetical protein
VNLVRYCIGEWLEVSETVHFAVFNEYRPKDLARIDFAYSVWDNLTPIGYVTCREMDAESIYIGYGGILPDSRDKRLGYESMLLVIEELKTKYKRSSMLVKNDNINMLKLALNLGFKIVGLRNANGEIFLEHSIEWGK